jgi:hypothetical protein
MLTTLAALTSATCGGGASDEPPIDIVATEYGFEVPDEVPAGMVRVRLSNQGTAAHAAQLYRLESGVGLADFVAAMERGIAFERPLATVSGGPANVDGGETGPTVEVHLEPGDYVIVCWLLDSSGTPHAFLGMVDTFRVTGEPVPEESPSAEGTFELTEYSIQVPDDFDGSGRFRVVNQGTEWHEMVVLALDEEEPQVALDHLTGVRQLFPQPYASRGGVTALEVDGGVGTVDLDLEAGRYLIVCTVPDVNERYHANLGMWAEVSIP